MQEGKRTFICTQITKAGPVQKVVSGPHSRQALVMTGLSHSQRFDLAVFKDSNLPHALNKAGIISDSTLEVSNELLDLDAIWRDHRADLFGRRRFCKAW